MGFFSNKKKRSKTPKPNYVESRREIPMELDSNINYTGDTNYHNSVNNQYQHGSFTDFAPPLPLDEYKLNEDSNPNVIKITKAPEKVKYVQEICVRYLKPPEPPKPGDIIIKQEPSRQAPSDPPLVIREEPPRVPTPPPLIIREAPPDPPQPLPGKVISVPGDVYPPPARNFILEKMPAMPPKPQKILIERWLPYDQQTQRVTYEPMSSDIPQLEDALKMADQKFVRQSQETILEGDIDALKLIDLDEHGLGYLKNSLNGYIQLENTYSSERPFELTHRF